MDFPWLPIGTGIPGGGASGRLLRGGIGWQVIATNMTGQVALLLDPGAQAAPPWWGDEIGLIRATFPLNTVTDGYHAISLLAMQSWEAPLTLNDLGLRSPNVTVGELSELLDAVEALKARRPSAAWRSALMLPGRRHLIPTENDPDEDRRAVVIAILSGGVSTPVMSAAQIREMNPWLTESEITGALRRLGLATPVGRRKGEQRPPETFTLAGQPGLERLFRERVVDILYRAEAYSRMGVTIPNGILLSGPPGSGKSFAAAKLASFLGWPIFDLRLSEIGSSLLHETGKRIASTFEAAASAAPAIVLLEELDAIGGARDRTHSAGVEEVNTLLREVEKAKDQSILVIATTNRPEAIDHALTRRGRFDVAARVERADASQAQAMLDSLLAERPCSPGLNTAVHASRLSGRPASDISWVVEEAARHAVSMGKQAIDDICLAAALRALSPSPA